MGLIYLSRYFSLAENTRKRQISKFDAQSTYNPRVVISLPGRSVGRPTCLVLLIAPSPTTRYDDESDRVSEKRGGASLDGWERQSESYNDGAAVITIAHLLRLHSATPLHLSIYLSAFRVGAGKGGRRGKDKNRMGAGRQPFH